MTAGPVVVVGVGRVGSFFLRAARAAGLEAAGLARDPRSAPLDLHDHVLPLAPLPGALRGRAVSALLLCVPDGAVREVVRSLPGALIDAAGAAVVAHTSGALPSDLLVEAGIPRECAVSCHPLFPFTSRARSPAPSRVICGVEGRGPGPARMAEVLSLIGCRSFGLRGDRRPLYHLACVLASNHLVTLAHVARDLGARATGGDPLLVAALDELIAATVENLRASPDAATALSGPLRRGDGETVAAHVEALRADAPALLPLYLELVRATLPMVEPEAALEVRRVLERPGDKGRGAGRS